MDVRCDRCQTEYELEDDSVAAGGASVQCTTCGHTFVVSRGKRDLTPTPGPTTEMAAAPAWVLMTEEGKTHRFRDPTTLQKWIVERRVGRNDRVTAPGASPRRLGDMDELRPFFELVDQADRAASARVARPTQPETPQRLSASARGYASPNYASPNYATPDVDDDDVLMSGRRSRAGGGQRGRVSRLDSDIAAGLTTMGMDDSMDFAVPQRNIARKVGLGILAAGLVAGGFYFGTRSGGPSKFFATATAPASTPAPPPPTPPVAAAPAPASAPPPTVTPTPPPAAAVPPTPAPAPAATAKTAPPEDVPPEPVPPARPSGRGAAAAAPAAETSGGRPRSYEQLVAEANRALENGNTAKAQKFVDDALKLQPSGVSAVTASAYLLLDKRKPLAAVGEFKRALNNAPNFPQALFGLGEAYRAAGDTGQAIDAYKKFLATAPSSEDAPAARRQLRELESQPARPSHSATANVPEQGGAPPPMPAPAPPP
jgi:predicted Zn finger-like uncharacterized protein